MIYIIANTSSRTGKAAKRWKEVKKILEENKIEYKGYKTEGKGHATALAKKLTTDLSCDITLVIFGGDGTINEVINGIQDFSKVRIGVIPTGSGNDFVRGIGITKNVKNNITNIINETNEVVVDLGLISIGDSKRYFAISQGMGMDAIVCKKALTSKQKKFLNKLHLGKLTYLLLTVETLFSMKKFNGKIRFDDEKMEFENIIFSAFMNTVYEGGGVPMAPEAQADDGKLSVCIASNLSKAGAFVRLPILVMAKHNRLKSFTLLDFIKAKVSLAEEVTLHADGEYLGEVSEFEVECVKGKMRLLK